MPTRAILLLLTDRTRNVNTLSFSRGEREREIKAMSSTICVRKIEVYWHLQTLFGIHSMIFARSICVVSHKFDNFSGEIFEKSSFTIHHRQWCNNNDDEFHQHPLSILVYSALYTMYQTNNLWLSINKMLITFIPAPISTIFLLSSATFYLFVIADSLQHA